MRAWFWPKTVVWETTLRCNMRCLHCGSSAGSPRGEEMDTTEALDVCRQLGELGAETVILSGGETLLRDDWPQIAEALLEQGITVGIITNGVLLEKNPRVVPTLQDLYTRSGGRISLGISLDGLEEAHDSIRGISGSHAQVVRCIKLAHSSEIPIIVLTTVHRENVSDLPALRELVFDLKPFAWQFQTCSVYGRMLERRDWLLTPEQYVELARFLAENRRLRSESPRTDPADCVGYFTDLEGELRDSPWPGCQAGVRAMGLEANGNVKGCLSLLDRVFVEGNVRETSLAELWDRPGAFAYNRGFGPEKLEGMCEGCEHGKRCAAGCRGVAHSVTGSYYEAPYCLYGYEKHGLPEDGSEGREA